MVVAARNFAQTIGQRLQTGSTSGGGGIPPPPPPPPPVSRPYMSLDVPSHGQPVSGSFAISGWALDAGAAAGTGVDTVHVWAQSVTTSEWIFLGAANMGVSRPDVGAFFQSARFSAAGFGLSASLPPGTYDINVFAHSVVTDTFNNVQTKRITVISPPSKPLMFIDLPVPEFNTTRGTVFTISGWAIDLSSSSGAGVDAVHVWAYPTTGGTPIMVGAAPVGHPRHDVSGVFGAKFVGAGYTLQGALPEGGYNLVVFAFSNVAQNFNNAAGIHMRVW
jgi:hypothetical protein